jgi:DivIVA domain-containing protein
VHNIFPYARKPKLGYNPEQVEEFFEHARHAYDVPDAVPNLTPGDIRTVAFSMQKGGYSTTHVDPALERLEDAFANRARDRTMKELGTEQWYSNARSTAQIILDRLNRPIGQRFAHTTILSTGYNRVDVDRFVNRLLRYFQDGAPLSINDVRTVVFRPQRRGYKETQVDLVLDAVVDVMLAVQ